MTEPSTSRGSIELRAHLRSERRARTDAVRSDAAKRVGAHLRDLVEPLAAGRLATFSPTDGELDPNVALDRLRDAGWSVHLPIVVAGTSLAFAPWDRTTRCVRNRYGIVEPDVEADEAIQADALDVVLVPCVAADLRGTRLGFGAGYYDRALARTRGNASRPLLIGVVWDAAVVDELPREEWDVPMDVVVTERRVVRPSG